MAFNTHDALEQGKVDFVFHCTPYDYNSLINGVRNSDRRNNIVKGFLPLLKETLPKFCFEIIYDMPEYVDIANYLLHECYTPKTISKEIFSNLLNNSSIGKGYLAEYFDEFINIYQKDLDFIFDYLFNNLKECFDMLHKLSIHFNLHIRYLFMYYLIKNHSDKIFLFYDDITRYLTSVTYEEYEQLTLLPEYMSMKDVSNLAYLIFETGLDYSIYERFKQFILENYQYNELVLHLLENKRKYITENSFRFVSNTKGIAEFQKDPITYFETAASGRIRIYQNFSSNIARELLEDYKRHLAYFYRKGKLDNKLNTIDLYGLGRKLEKYVDKYLSLSKTTEHSYIKSGSTSSVYHIGDFVFKLDESKWSYEDIICPDLYIILPNLEEDFIRDEHGIIITGIEVQKYLSRDARNIPNKVIDLYREELRQLGYYTTDSLMYGPCGDNCRLLDSYLEAGNPNPPDWFKEYPLVLVDRDRVYKLENHHPKQLSNHY